MLLRSFSGFYLRISSSYPKVMEKTQVLTFRFQEINNMLVSTKEQLTKYEQEFYEKTLVAYIEKKNHILQSRVKDAVEELTALQRLEPPNKALHDSQRHVSFAPSRDEKVVSEKAPKQLKEDQKLATSGHNEDRLEKPKKLKEDKKPAAPGQNEAPVDVGRLDMRIGRIVDIKKHPDADALYVEQVDIGKPNPITVVSGLVKHVPIEEMQNRLVVILTNLKPAKMRGVTSEGMVMCASTPDKVEVLRPPTAAVPGDVVVVPGYAHAPDPVMNPKKKIFETVAPDLKTDDDLCATYKGAKWVVEGKGFITADSLKGVNVK